MFRFFLGLHFSSLLCALCILIGSAVSTQAQDLVLPATGIWNGFLRQVNILECVNAGQEDLSLKVSVNQSDGTLLGTFDLNISRGATEHYSLSAFNLTDRHGTYRISRNDNQSRITGLSCMTTFYRLATTTQKALEYAYALPVLPAKQGENIGVYNSMDPEGGPIPIANWLTLQNPSDSTLILDVRVFAQDGTYSPERSFLGLNIDAGRRMDVPLGHPEGQNVGLYKIIPQSPEMQYNSFLVRFKQRLDGTYAFAFPLLPARGTCAPPPIPASTMGPAINWGEIANPTSVSVPITISVKDRNGVEVFSEQRVLEPHSQHHVFLNQHIGNYNVGTLSVSCSIPSGELLVQSLYYGQTDDAFSQLEWAYGTQAQELLAPQGAELVTLYNTNLGAANWAKVSEAANSTNQISLATYDVSGLETSFQQLAFQSTETKDLSIHQRVATDSFGSVKLISSQLNSLYAAELIRVFPRANGQIGYIMNVPSRYLLKPLINSTNFATRAPEQSVCSRADLNSDGFINQRDLQLLLSNWSTPVADINFDGSTSQEDLVLLSACFDSHRASLNTGNGPVDLSRFFCTDSDAGENIHLAGTTRMFIDGELRNSISDLCFEHPFTRQVSLIEYFCQGNFLTNKSVNCTHGCQNGACLASPNNESNPNNQLCNSVSYNIPHVPLINSHAANITFHFSTDVECGQFVDGTWWVKGPVTISRITPDYLGFIPNNIDTYPQGLKDAIVQYLQSQGQQSVTNNQIKNVVLRAHAPNSSPGLGYSAVGNIPHMRNGFTIDPLIDANNLDDRLGGSGFAQPPLLPMTLAPMANHANTVIKAASRFDMVYGSTAWSVCNKSPFPFFTDNPHRGCLQSIAILTVVGTKPPADAFRPTMYASSVPKLNLPALGGINKKFYVASDLNLQLLPKLNPNLMLPAARAALPSLVDTEKIFGCPWHHFFNDGASMSQQQTASCFRGVAGIDYFHYHAGIANQINKAMLRTMLNDSDSAKKPLVNKITQYAIDTYGSLLQGKRYDSATGFNMGAKAPLLYAGKLLNETKFLNVGFDFNAVPENKGGVTAPNGNPITRYFAEDAQTFFGDVTFNGHPIALWGYAEVPGQFFTPMTFATTTNEVYEHGNQTRWPSSTLLTDVYPDILQEIPANGGFGGFPRYYWDPSEGFACQGAFGYRATRHPAGQRDGGYWTDLNWEHRPIVGQDSQSNPIFSCPRNNKLIDVLSGIAAPSAASYQNCCSSFPMAGAFTVIKLMDTVNQGPSLETKWNHVPFFNYVSRWVSPLYSPHTAIGGGWADTTINNFYSAFLKQHLEDTSPLMQTFVTAAANNPYSISNGGEVAPVLNGLLIDMKFEDNLVSDANGSLATWNGNELYAQSYNGTQAARLNGSSSFTISQLQLVGLQGNGLTLSSRIKFDSTALTRAFWWHGLIESEFENNQLKFFRITTDTGVYSLGHPAPFISTNIQDGAWHHLVIRYDQQTGIFEIIIDGQVVASRNGVTGGLVAPTSSHVLTIGASPWSGHMQGLIDDLKIYNEYKNISDLQ